MMGKTHLAAGILAGEITALAYYRASIIPALIVIGTAAIGSLLPDIDHPGSLLSSSTRLSCHISNSIAAVTPHRGLTHTPIFAGLIIAVLYYFLQQRISYCDPICIGLAVGILSHLVLDTLTERGVMWAWPIIPNHLRLCCIRSNHTVERLLRGIMSTGAVVLGAGFVVLEIRKYTYI